MAVNKSEQAAKLMIKVQTGVNASGNPVYRQRSFASMNPALADEDVLNIGTTIGQLQKHNVESISRQDNAVLATA